MTSGWQEVLDASALEQAAMVASGKLSSTELTQLYLDRIEALNPTLNAFVRVKRKAALKDAARKDALTRSRGSSLPPFHGVPTAIKDLNLLRGYPTHFGSRAVWLWSPVDCRTTASLRRGGFVFLGKTATSELGALPVTEPDTHPPTRNPWDPDVTSGGSSGGASSAVAAGLVPVAHGSDGGGSVRIPASLCHLFGFKPSRGRVPNAYRKKDRHILYSCGPLTRSVTDAAAMVDLMAGLDIGKPHWLEPPPAPYATLVNTPPRPLRILMTTHTALAPTHQEMDGAVRAAAKVLEGLGHHVEEVAPPEGSIEEFLPAWQRLMADAPVLFNSRLQPVTRWLRDPGRKITRQRALEIQLAITQRILATMGDADIWLTPTVPVPTPTVGQWKNLPPDQAFGQAAQMGVFTATCNITGAPAATIPVGLRGNRWPMGAHLVGRLGDDATVLQVSRQLEQAMPWRHIWAPLAGKN